MKSAWAWRRAADFVRFIDRDFAFYGHWYEQLRRAADHLTPGLECVYFNAEHNFTLQYPVLLAPLGVDDDEPDDPPQASGSRRLP